MQKGEWLPFSLRSSFCILHSSFCISSHYHLHPALARAHRGSSAPVGHFLAEAAATLGKPKPTAPRDLFTHLNCYAFPGNVRELRAMALDAVAAHLQGVLSLHRFLDHIDRADSRRAPCGAVAARGIAFGPTLPKLKQATDLLFAEALARANGNQHAAARLLGISRRTMNRHNAPTYPSPEPSP
ncbi:MAG: helix-turn-helix domain-containing protein [Verrucomicrobiota bacterium]